MASNDDRRPGVGVAVLIHSENGVLLVQRTAHGKGSWSVPGGYLEAGESLEDAARREVREETDIPLDGDLEFVGVTNDRFDDGLHNITIWFSASQPRDSDGNDRSPEVSALRWFQWSELPSDLYPSTREMLSGNSLPPNAIDRIRADSSHRV